MTDISCHECERHGAGHRFKSHLFRSMTLAGFVSAAVFAFAGSPQAAEDRNGEIAGDQDISLFGSYLAARQASNDRDRSQAARFLHDALKRDPDNRMLLERAVVYELSSGNFDEALAIAPKAVKAVSNNLGANILLALQAMQEGNFPVARVRLLSNDSGPIARLASGLLEMWVHQASGDLEAARAGIAELEEGSSFGTFRTYHAALLADLQGRGEDAEKFYAKAFEAATDLRTVDAYGRFLERHGKQEKALAIYDEFLTDAPNHPIIAASVKRVRRGEFTGPLVGDAFEGAAETLYAMGSALTQDGGGDLALIYLNLALFARPDFDMANFLIADIHDRQNRYEEAIDAYSAIPSTSPLKREAEIQAALNLDSLERADEAKVRLDGLINIDPGDRAALISAGDLMRAGEQFAEAIPYYDKAIEQIVDPGQDDWRLFYFRGICYERTDAWQLAENDFKKALELEPEQPLVLNYLGYSWIDIGINLDEALDMVKRAVGQRPDDGYIVDSLGWAYYRLGDFKRAVEELERAVELRPDDSVINEHLGDAYWRVGRLVEARFQWDHALAMEPEEADIEKIEVKLARGLDAVEKNERVVAETTPSGEVQVEVSPMVTPEPAEVTEPEADVAAVAGPEQQEPKTHKVETGDTLWGLAVRYLGAGALYEMLFEANRDKVGDANTIYPGDELVIPDAN